MLLWRVGGQVGGSKSFVRGGLYCRGWKTAEEVWHKIKSGVLDIHFLMLAVAVGAACVGHWDEGALLLFLFSLSGALEELAAYRTERELAGLFRAAPREAIRILEDGTEEKVAVDLLEPGMRVRVRPGDGFPVDAEVIEEGVVRMSRV